MTSELVPARGPAADYCPGVYGEEGHHMVSRSAGAKVRFVEICTFCGWINGVALDAYADNAIKEALTARAGRIAVATETEPFAIVQPSSGEVSLREILTQGLAAAYSIGLDGSFNDLRMRQILDILQGEMERIVRAGELAAGQKVEAQIEPDVKAWMDLAYEMYAMLCNSAPLDEGADAAEWHACFERLKNRFHELLPEVKEEGA